MGDVSKLPPPRRFVVSENEDEILFLNEVTGTEDPVYIVGRESPWLGVSLDDVEKWALDGSYGPNTWRLLNEIKRAREGETFFESDDPTTT